MTRLESLFFEMIKFDKGSAERIQHFTKVHAYSRYIGRMENIDEKTLEILEATAYVHDIGIKVANKLHGYYNGKLQEELGPDAAKVLLEKVGFEADIVERVMYIVGHHHTYDNIVGLDYQILVEADFLVNLEEHKADFKAVEAARNKIFKTKTGLKMLELFFCEEE